MNRWGGVLLWGFCFLSFNAWGQGQAGRMLIQSGHSQSPNDIDSAILDEAEFQDSLVSVLERELKTRYSGGEDRPAIFNTNLDWHSSVHGHWALLRLNRSTGRYADLAELVESRLTREGIDSELKFLKSATDYEFPYGRAWFLKLAIEFHQWAEENGVGDRARLRQTADYVAANILERFTKRDNLPVSVGEYQNPAWALVQLFHYYQFYEETEKLSKVKNLIQTHFIDKPIGEKSFKDDLGSGQYFSHYGNWLYLLTETQSDEVLEAFLDRHPISDEALEIPRQAIIRVSGLVWNRARALRSLILRLNQIGMDSTRYQISFEKHYNAGVTFHQRWKDNTSYSHWVSQFAVYAITEQNLMFFGSMLAKF